MILEFLLCNTLLNEVNLLKLSVVIPIYNSKKYLHRCLDCILQQSFNDFEIIIVDDGSTDNPKDIIDPYILLDKRISYYYTENHGVSDARNYGIEKINGEYLMFCDVDDYYTVDYFGNMISLIERTHTNIAMCNFYLVRNSSIYPNKIPNVSGEGILNSVEALELILLDNGFKGFVWNKIYRVSVIDKYRFDNRINYLEDLLFNVLIFKDNNQIGYNTNCLYFYCKNIGSASSKLNQDFYDSLLTIRKMVPDKIRYITDANLLYSLISDHKGKSDVFKTIKNENRVSNLHLHNLIKNFIVKISFFNPAIATWVSDILGVFLTSNMYLKLRKLIK